MLSYFIYMAVNVIGSFDVKNEHFQKLSLKFFSSFFFFFLYKKVERTLQAVKLEVVHMIV